MKFQSMIMSAGNVLISIVVFVSTMYNHIYYYAGYKNVFYALLFLIVIANGILAISAYKRNRATTVLDGIIAILWIMIVVLGISASIDNDINSSLLIIKGTTVLIALLSIVECFFIPKTKNATELNAINIEVEKHKQEESKEETTSIDEAFKVKSVGKKEEAIGIANLISKMIVPILWGIFAIALVIQIIEPGKIYGKDKEVLLSGLKEIGDYQQKSGYIYKSSESEYQFLDENGTYLTRITAEQLSNFNDNYTWKINYPDNNHTVEVLIAKQKDKVQVLNTEGKVLIELDKRYDGEAYRTVCYLIKQAVESGDLASSVSIQYEENKERAEGSIQETKTLSEQDYGFETKINAYYKIDATPELKEFEENANYKYLYFKNDRLSENILQIAMTKENSAEVPFLEKYLKHKETVFNITDEHKDAIQEFYRYKKEYKLIHLPSKTTVSVNAQDMFYDKFTINGEENEVIYAYADGSIPFMNAEYNSYVTTDGRVLGKLNTTGNEASVFSIVDDTNIIATRIDTQLSIIYNKAKVMADGKFEGNVNRHEGKKIVELGVCYYLYPIDKADTNQESMLQTKGYSNYNGLVKSESSQVKFIGPTILTMFNKDRNKFETYYYSRGDLLNLFTQEANPKMYAIGMQTALPGGYSPYDLIGIYDK